MSAKPTTNPTTPIPHDQIAERARQLWKERGSPGGRELEHWLDAERQLRVEARRSGRSSSGKGLNEAESRLDGLIEPPPTPASRTPAGEQL
jgi:hypothetical protein